MKKVLLGIVVLVLVLVLAIQFNILRLPRTWKANPPSVSTTTAALPGDTELPTGVGTKSNGGTSPILAGKSVMLSFVFGGVKRSYVLHVPKGYDGSKKYPLMLSFHGNGGSGVGQETKSGFSTVADAHSFLVAYPDSDPNYKEGGQWKLLGANNDIDFSKALIAAVESRYSIDASRIYVSGFSMGGGITQALACSYPSKLAGFAVVSENLKDNFASRCDPSVPISAVFFHGTADTVSPYAGGANGLNGTITWSSQKTTEFWVDKNGCSTPPATERFPDTLTDGSKVTDTKQVWTGCRAETSVTFYTIEGGGHAWPGGTPSKNNQVGPASTGLNASLVIWQLLSPMRR